MDSSDKSIIRMANDIAVNLSAMGDKDALAEHINKFWSPDMRKRLFELFYDDPDAFNHNIAIVRNKIKCEQYNSIVYVSKDNSGTGG